MDMDKLSIIYLLILITSHAVFAQNADTNITTAPVEGTPEEEMILRRPIDKALQPVYTMTNFFLETILNPPSIVSLNEQVNLTDFSSLGSSFKSDWQIWVKHYSNYLICAVVSVVYALGLSITACVICGCRKRGRCGGKKGPKDSIHMRHKRITCTFLLGVVAVCSLLGVTAIFISNMLIYEQTESEGVPATLSASVSHLETFIELAKYDFEMYIGKGMKNSLNNFGETVKNIPQLSQSEAGQISGVGPSITVIESYVSQLNGTMDALLMVDESVSDINTAVTALDDILAQLQTNITQDFTSCSVTSQVCERILNMSNSLSTTADFTGPGVPSMVNVISEFNSAMNGVDNVFSGLLLAVLEYDKLSNAVLNSSNSTLVDLESESSALLGEVDTFTKEALDFIDQVSLKKTMELVNGTINPYIQEYGAYRYYGGIVFASLILLLVTLACFSLIVGACGSRPGQGSLACDKGTASKMLWATIILLPILSWIFGIISVILLVIGGIPHNDICNHLYNPEDTKAVNIIDDVLSKNFNLSFSFYEMYINCGNDEALYTALQLDQQGQEFNLEEILDPDAYNMKSNLDTLKTKTYNVGTINIMNNILENKLMLLETAEGTINLADHEQELDTPIISSNLSSFEEYLRKTAQSNSALATKMLYHADVIANIISRQYREVALLRLSLTTAVSTIKTFKRDFNISLTVSQLKSDENNITPSLLSDAVANVVDAVYADYLTMLDEADTLVRRELAQCTPVANTIQDTLDSVCIQFLYPFNAFWFATGWTMFFFIFLIPIGVILGDFYRKTEKYKPLNTTLDHPDGSRRRVSEDGLEPRRHAARNNHQPPSRVPYEQLPAIPAARPSPQHYHGERHAQGHRDQLDTYQDNTWDSLVVDYEHLQNQHNDGHINYGHSDYDNAWHNLDIQQSNRNRDSLYPDDTLPPYYPNSANWM